MYTRLVKRHTFTIVVRLWFWRASMLLMFKLCNNITIKYILSNDNFIHFLKIGFSTRCWPQHNFFELKLKHHAFCNQKVHKWTSPIVLMFNSLLTCFPLVFHIFIFSIACSFGLVVLSLVFVVTLVLLVVVNGVMLSNLVWILLIII